MSLLLESYQVGLLSGFQLDLVDMGVLVHLKLISADSNAYQYMSAFLWT
jgi:hypothetical protein